MSEEADKTNLIDALGPIMDEHVEWFAQLVRSTFYPDAPKSKQDIDMPESFEVWIEEAESEAFIDTEEYKNLQKLYKDLREAAEAFLGFVHKNNKPPTIKLYDEVASLYDYFVIKIRRIEHENLIEEGGVDHETGLRSEAALHKDLERELERRTRKGEPFAVVVVHLDFLEQIMAQGEEELHRVIAAGAEGLKACIRPFDDAYHLDGGAYALCLRSTDETGAGAAIRRIRDHLEQTCYKSYDAEGNVASLSMSYCLSEINPGDEIKEVLLGMREELKKHEDKPDSFLHFQEVSPLQRYMSDLESDDNAS